MILVKQVMKKIYAAGDVTLGPQFVYVAAYEGGIITDNAIGGLKQKNRFIGSSLLLRLRIRRLQRLVFLTEEQAKRERV